MPALGATFNTKRGSAQKFQGLGFRGFGVKGFKGLGVGRGRRREEMKG